MTVEETYREIEYNRVYTRSESRYFRYGGSKMNCTKYRSQSNWFGYEKLRWFRDNQESQIDERSNTTRDSVVKGISGSSIIASTNGNDS